MSKFVDYLLEDVPSAGGKTYYQVGCPHEYGYEQAEEMNRSICQSDCMQCWNREAPAERASDRFSADSDSISSFLKG